MRCCIWRSLRTGDVVREPDSSTACLFCGNRALCSPAEVAVLLLDMFKQCGSLNFAMVEATLQKEAALKAKNLRSTPGAGADEPDDIPTSIQQGTEAGGLDAMEEDDSDSDEHSSDDHPQQQASAPRVKAAPVIDADGFETVLNKKKGRARNP